MRAAIVIAALLLVLVAAWLAFCFGDWRRGKGICPVHGIAMETVIVHPPAGLAPSYAPGYYDDRERYFPNARQDTVGGDVWWRAGLIYVCPECERAKTAWRP
jgi:hypothetical protein